MTSLQPTSIPSASSTTMTSITITDHHEKLVSQAKERKEKIQQNHVKAEEHAKSGDELFEKENYLQASYFYSDAVKLWNTNVEFHVKLATAYVKAKQYEQAAFIATRALTMNPKLLEARYQRGLARLEQGLFEAARIDFSTILDHSPSHNLAATALTKANTPMTSQGPSSGGDHGHTNRNTTSDLDFQFPAYEEVEVDLAELSESEECGHVGNRVPCKYYNRKEGGCARGLRCRFMHAPDERSVRDNLGRNMCAYLLLGSCRFKDSCVYSHDKEWLPSKGWWVDPAQTERMKRLVALTEKNTKEQRELEQQLQRVQVHDKGKRKSYNNNRGRNANNPGQKRHRYTRQARGQVRPPPSEEQLQKELEGLGERMNNFGFTYDEVDELMCQGVKPWDDDAWDVMHALSYM